MTGIAEREKSLSHVDTPSAGVPFVSIGLLEMKFRDVIDEDVLGWTTKVKMKMTALHDGLEEGT